MVDKINTILGMRLTLFIAMFLYVSSNVLFGLADQCNATLFLVLSLFVRTLQGNRFLFLLAVYKILINFFRHFEVFASEWSRTNWACFDTSE